MTFCLVQQSVQTLFRLEGVDRVDQNSSWRRTSRNLGEQNTLVGAHCSIPLLQTLTNFCSGHNKSPTVSARCKYIVDGLSVGALLFQLFTFATFDQCSILHFNNVLQNYVQDASRFRLVFLCCISRQDKTYTRLMPEHRRIGRLRRHGK